MTQPRSLPRRRRALLMAPLMLGGLAILAGPAMANEAPQPNLTIEKHAEKGVAPGELAHWTITVTNEGAVDDKGEPVSGAAVAVEDVIVRDETASKDALVPDEAPSSGVLLPGQTLRYSVTTLATREQCETGMTNTATVELAAKGGLVESRTDDNSATAQAPVYCSVDVALDKTSDRESYAPGDTVNYLITVTNVGHYDVNLADMTVRDAQLSDLRLVVEIDKDGKAPTSIAPGESVRFAGSRVIGADECGPLSNTATVELESADKKKGDLVDRDLTDNADTHVVSVEGGACAPPPVVPSVVRPVVSIAPAPAVVASGTPAAAAPAPAKTSPPKPGCARVSLRTTIAGPGALVAGQRGTYRVTVANTGASRAHGASVRVAIPTGMSVVGRAPKGARIVGGQLVWNLAAISGYGQRTVRATFRADADTSGRHSARAVASARCAAQAADVHAVRVAAVRAVTQPAVAG